MIDDNDNNTTAIKITLMLGWMTRIGEESNPGTRPVSMSVQKFADAMYSSSTANRIINRFLKPIPEISIDFDKKEGRVESVLVFNQNKDYMLQNREHVFILNEISRIFSVPGYLEDSSVINNQAQPSSCCSVAKY